jgi:hypothetical protein
MRNQFYTTLPVTSSAEAALGFFCYSNDTGIPGVTSLTFKHTLTTSGFDIEDCSDLLTLSFPNLVSSADNFNDYISVFQNPSLTELNLPKLEAVTFMYIQQNSSLQELSLPSLIHTTGLIVQDNDAITSVDCPVLEESFFGLAVTGNPSLTDLNLPVCVLIGEEGDVDCSNNINLANVTFPRSGSFSGLNFSNNALTQTSVDNILVMLVSSSNMEDPSPWSGELHLEGGSNSYPSDVGVDAGTILSNRNASVYYNPPPG